MIDNRVAINRRIILSSKQHEYFDQQREEDTHGINQMKNECCDDELLFNEDNQNYILGYN